MLLLWIKKQYEGCYGNYSKLVCPQQFGEARNEHFATELNVTKKKIQNLPKIVDWFNPDLTSKSYEELLALSKDLNLDFEFIEAATRDQSQCNLWYKY